MSTIQRVQGRNSLAASLAWVCASAVMLQVFGCSRYVEDKWSRARPATHRAGGVVEYQGQPVSRATVTFVGRDESRGKEFAAVGFTDDRGRFSLKTFRLGDGAVVGSHRVKIEKQSLGGGQSATEEPPKNRQDYDAQRAAEPRRAKIESVLPARYSSFETSGLMAEVTAKGPNEFVFTLDGSPPPSKAGRQP